jgi:hypothetical protein
MGAPHPRAAVAGLSARTPDSTPSAKFGPAVAEVGGATAKFLQHRLQQLA